jgi:hypothetical protein
VLDKLAYGWSPEEIHFQHPALSLAQIHAALSYYYENLPRMARRNRSTTAGSGAPRRCATGVSRTQEASRPQERVSIGLCMDVHVPRAVTDCLFARACAACFALPILVACSTQSEAFQLQSTARSGDVPVPKAKV